MKKRIIVTSGPTNERIDAVMKITNMSTGSLGARIVETLLDTPDYAGQIDEVCYISQKLARKPVVPDGQAYKLKLIQVESTQDLLDALTALLTDKDHPVDAVIHSAAVGDYKGRYVARAEDLAMEISRRNEQDGTLSYEEILSILEHPECVQNDATKISSYEPNLMCMLDLTPKVISHIKELSPDTMLIGFKLLEGVTNNELFQVAKRLLDKNNADYIMANDLARIGNGRHWGMVIGKDGLVTECETKDEIASVLARLLLHETVEYRSYSGE